MWPLNQVHLAVPSRSSHLLPDRRKFHGRYYARDDLPLSPASGRAESTGSTRGQSSDSETSIARASRPNVRTQFPPAIQRDLPFVLPCADRIGRQQESAGYYKPPGILHFPVD